MVVKLLLAIMFLSPFWPIGQNPIVGDPFIIVNKTTNQLAFIEGGQIQEIYKVATGLTEDLTPEGKFTITVKAKNPYYRKKDIEGGAKENPLGTRWIGFDADGTDGRIYGVHGNNNRDSIGRYITQGCIRMYNERVEELFEKVPIGTKIVIVSSEKTFEEIGVEHGAIPKATSLNLNYIESSSKLITKECTSHDVIVSACAFFLLTWMEICIDVSGLSCFLLFCSKGVKLLYKIG